MKARHILWTIVVAPLVAFGLLFIDWGFLDNTATVYMVECKVDASNNYCSAPGKASGTVVYKVYPEQHAVVQQMSGIGPTRFPDCAIVDRLNWECKYLGNDDGSHFGLTNGVFSELLVNRHGWTDDIRIYYAQKWRWWIQWL